MSSRAHGSHQKLVAEQDVPTMRGKRKDAPVRRANRTMDRFRIEVAPGLCRQAGYRAWTAGLRPVSLCLTAPGSQGAQLCPPLGQQCPLALPDLFLYQALDQRAVALLGRRDLGSLLFPRPRRSRHAAPFPSSSAHLLSLALQDSCLDLAGLVLGDRTFGVLPPEVNSVIILTKL